MGGGYRTLETKLKKCFIWFSCLDFVRSIGSLLWWNISDRGGYAGMAPVGELRTLKPVIIIPPQGTSSHPATHYNPFYFNAGNDILYNSRTELGLHNSFHPTIRDWSMWSKFGARGEHGDVLQFSTEVFSGSPT